ncbi:hypothetical protein BUALT_Bualt02G0230000 [Buddleja alternifolia]|uniref:Uncharacterized protein n=1 Tax=Buddleja alternifolia TaxID=168488 RepID=A0AAV6Y4Q3_9LAMI|nr:hypothetical protein BUALT_Bualt02G0230000 [Buddleja alternifolia]
MYMLSYNNLIPMCTIRLVADWAKSSGVKQFLFIISAGIYSPTDEPPSVEGYMIGSGNNKDYEEWFFDQLTNIAQVKDLSSMLTLAVNKPDAASGCIFNCVNDRAVTLDGMAKLCAQAAGRPVEIVHYEPKAVGVDAKKAFPFYPISILSHELIHGWTSTTKLAVDLKDRFEEYLRIGRDKEESNWRWMTRYLKP